MSWLCIDLSESQVVLVSRSLKLLLKESSDKEEIERIEDVIAALGEVPTLCECEDIGCATCYP